MPQRNEVKDNGIRPALGKVVNLKYAAAGDVRRNSSMLPRVTYTFQYWLETGEQVEGNITFRSSTLESTTSMSPGTIHVIYYRLSDFSIAQVGIDFIPGSYEEQQYNDYLVKLGLSTYESIHRSKVGVKTKGVLLSLAPTGHQKTGFLEYRIEFILSNSYWRAAAIRLIMPQQMKYLLVGAVMDVYYYPDNPQQISFKLPIS